MKTIKLLCLIVFVIWSSPLHATTLLDADWATGTGCGCTAAADGIWSVCTQTIGECSFEVKTGGYGGRNQLSFNFDGVNNHLRANSPSMGGPSTAYIRFWFRRNSACDGQIHPMYISSGTAVDSGFAPIREYESGSTFSIIPNVYQADPSGGYFYYTGTVSIGTWYRLEYKVENGGTSSGSITVRLDGVDITSSMRTAGGTYLSAANGSLTLQALNYVNFEIYDGHCTANWLDIAGLKITDGPDWIGGDSGGDTTAPTVTISTADPSSITSDSLSISGTASDNVGVSSCKWRIGSAPDASNGTALTGTTSWSGTTSGFARGENTLYTGCTDAAGNWGSDSMVVNYLPAIQGVSVNGLSIR